MGKRGPRVETMKHRVMKVGRLRVRLLPLTHELKDTPENRALAQTTIDALTRRHLVHEVVELPARGSFILFGEQENRKYECADAPHLFDGYQNVTYVRREVDDETGEEEVREYTAMVSEKPHWCRMCGRMFFRDMNCRHTFRLTGRGKGRTYVYAGDSTHSQACGRCAPRLRSVLLEQEQGHWGLLAGLMRLGLDGENRGYQRRLLRVVVP